MTFPPELPAWTYVYDADRDHSGGPPCPPTPTPEAPMPDAPASTGPQQRDPVELLGTLHDQLAARQTPDRDGFDPEVLASAVAAFLGPAVRATHLDDYTAGLYQKLLGYLVTATMPDWRTDPRGRPAELVAAAHRVQVEAFVRPLMNIARHAGYQQAVDDMTAAAAEADRATAEREAAEAAASEREQRTKPKLRYPSGRPGWLGTGQPWPCGRCRREVDDEGMHACISDDEEAARAGQPGNDT